MSIEQLNKHNTVNDMFDVFYIGKNQDLKRKIPFAKQIDSENDINTLTKMYWLIESGTNIVDYDIFDYRPPEYDQCYEHVFYKGIKLIPINPPKGIKYSDLYNPEFDVVRALTPEKYFEANPSKTHVWGVDPEYLILDEIKWSPDVFDIDYIHNFHVPGQLAHKYPEKQGGINLYPRDWKNAEIKYHGNLSSDCYKTDEFDVVRALTPEKYFEANPSKTHVWGVDPEYLILDEIKWSPDVFDIDYIHNFHIPGQLTHKYPEKQGGVNLYPRNWKNADIKYHGNLSSDCYKTDINYPVYRVEDPSNHKPSEACWAIDRQYVVDDDDFHIIPWQDSNEKAMIHVFHLQGQLKHKYPEAMGGVYWYPGENYSEIKIHASPLQSQTDFPVYDNEETGRAECRTEWFWVVDPEVEILETFDFDYIPEVWDAGNIHVWQKLNPKTGLPYDYSGVWLYPRNVKSKRPKYIKTPACKQKEFPVYYLDHKKDQIKQLEKFDKDTQTAMFYVVDPLVKLKEDFDFSYYPAQWDQRYVHVFQCDDEYRGLRLYPKGYITSWDLTIEDITHNRMKDIKYLNINVTEKKNRWPVEKFTTQSKEELTEILERHHDYEYVFTLDDDVELSENFNDQYFIPEPLHMNKIHLWQRTIHDSPHIHSYGGLRLWPTDLCVDEIKSKDIEMNRLKSRRYVRKPGSVYHNYDIVFISYHDSNAAKKLERIKELVTNEIYWVKDVDGIFNAHKKAADSVSTKMFWVIDSDAEIYDEFNFNFIPEVYDQDVVHVWHSYNPVINTEYGYGGVKLFNTEQIRNATSWGLDFTTGLSSRMKVIPEVACITNFNIDPFNTWRSAFRESVKLMLRDDDESKHRLKAWLNPSSKSAFSKEAKKGAQEGKYFAQRNRNRPKQLEKINDYDWLKNEFNKIDGQGHGKHGE